MDSNPYEGISMPTPPEGYRLAEWGESLEGKEGLLWMRVEQRWSRRWNLEGCQYFSGYPESCIFAIPIEPEPEPVIEDQTMKTLADMPEGVLYWTFLDGDALERHRIGDSAYTENGSRCRPASEYEIIKEIGKIGETPDEPSVETVPAPESTSVPVAQTIRFDVLQNRIFDIFQNFVSLLEGVDDGLNPSTAQCRKVDGRWHIDITCPGYRIELRGR